MSKLSQLGRNTPLWRRVQRHAQMSAIFGPPVATAVSSSPTFAPAQPVPTETLERWEVFETAVPQNQSVPTLQPVEANAPAESEKAEDETNWRRLQTIMARHRLKQAAEIAGDPVQREIETSAEPITPETPAPSIKEAAANNAPPLENSTLTIQPVPLETVWPVQKKDQMNRMAAGESKPDAKVPIVQRQQLPPQEATKINQNLSQVAPGRHTESPIETILPSRPRPQAKMQSGTQRPSNAEPDVPAVKQDVPPPPPQMVEETAVPHSTPSKLVQTEIGPLPVDLWETLGQTPPGSTPIEPETTPNETKQSSLEVSTTQTTNIARKEAFFPEQPAADIAVQTPEGNDLPETAVPISEPLPFNATPNPIMAKPIDRSMPYGSPAVSKNTAVLPVESNPSSAKSTIPPSLTSPANTVAPFSQTEAVIQRQLAETNFLPQSFTSTSDEAASQEVSQNYSIEPPESPSTGQPIEPGEAKVIIDPPLPVSSYKQQTPLNTPISAKPVTMQPIQPTTSAISEKETAVSPSSLLWHQTGQAQPETVVQRMPDMPQMMETAVAAAGLPDMMSSLDTAVSNEEPSEFEVEASAPKDDLDIDALSRQVYQQLKRKLAVEWERGYGR